MRPVSGRRGRGPGSGPGGAALLHAEVPHHVDQLLHLVLIQVDIHVGGDGEGGLDGDGPVGGAVGVGAAKANLLVVGGDVSGRGVGGAGLDFLHTVVQDHGVGDLGVLLGGHREALLASALALVVVSEGQRGLIVSSCWAWCETV